MTFMYINACVHRKFDYVQRESVLQFLHFCLTKELSIIEKAVTICIHWVCYDWIGCMRRPLHKCCTKCGEYTAMFI